MVDSSVKSVSYRNTLLTSMYLYFLRDSMKPARFKRHFSFSFMARNREPILNRESFTVNTFPFFRFIVALYFPAYCTPISATSVGVKSTFTV